MSICQGFQCVCIPTFQSHKDSLDVQMAACSLLVTLAANSMYKIIKLCVLKDSLIVY